MRWLLAAWLSGCVVPVRRDAIVSPVAVDCPSLGPVQAHSREGLRRQAVRRGANYVVLRSEDARWSRRFSSPPRRPAFYLDVYFARDRWLEGEALKCGRLSTDS